MKRRQLLSGMAIAAGLATTPPLYAAQRFSSLRDEKSQQLLKRLRGLLGDETSAAAIGRAYFSTEPKLDMHDVLNRLVTDLGGETLVLNSSRQQLKLRFSERRRQDFMQKNVLRVEGWVLSSSEVKLYALAALA